MASAVEELDRLIRLLSADASAPRDAIDEGLVSDPEPFRQLFNQGMLTAYAYKDETGRLVPADEVVEREDGTAVLADGGRDVERVVAKMSKSLKNVVNPDAVIEEMHWAIRRLRLV